MKIKNWIVRKMFERHFIYFIYPFETANDIIERMPEHKQFKYYEECKAWYESEAGQIERRENIRVVYEALANKPVKEPLFTAYRLLLYFKKVEERRLKELSENYEKLLITDKANKSLDKINKQ